MAKKQPSAAMQALLEQAKAEKRADKVWKGTEGTSICGIIRRMRPAKGNNDNTYIILTIEDEDGELWIVNAGATIMDEIELKGMVVGGSIAIFDHGSTRVKNGTMRVQTCAYAPPAGGSRKPG